MMDLNELDLRQEGRITTLEAKVDEVLPLIRDLHEDLVTRKARWSFLTTAAHYIMWALAGAVSYFGVAKSEVIASWLGQYPKH